MSSYFNDISSAIHSIFSANSLAYLNHSAYFNLDSVFLHCYYFAVCFLGGGYNDSHGNSRSPVGR